MKKSSTVEKEQIPVDEVVVLQVLTAVCNI